MTQIQNQAIIVSSQGEVKSQLQTQSQDRVSSQDRGSQASSCVASQGQVLTQTQLQTESQDRARFQVQVAKDSTRQATGRKCDCCQCCKALPRQRLQTRIYQKISCDEIMRQQRLNE